MKEIIIQFEKLLSELNDEISKQIYMESISLEALNENMKEWENDDFLKEHTEKFFTNFKKHKSAKHLKLFYEDYIPEIKSLLSQSLEIIRLVEEKKIKKLNSEIKTLQPNREFLKLLEKRLLSTEQEIFGTFKKQTFVGHLTKDGFFELDINGKKIPCPDFKYATLFAWNKEISNDGWYAWSTIDNKTRKTKPLTYFRNQLKKFL